MNQPTSAIRYEPSVEGPEPDEHDTQTELIATMRKIQETTWRDGGHALRSVHAKSHGLLRGELRVLDDLPKIYAQGLFASPGSYPIVMRLSTTPGDILDDSVSTPRGLAFKVFGVEGERLSGSEDDVTQDFVLVNGPAFVKHDAKHFLRSLKLLAATTDKMPDTKKVISAVMQGAEHTLESFGVKSPAIVSMGGQPETHLLGDTYYSQVPFLYGDYMAKFALTPASPALAALTNASLDLDGKPNGLREAVVDFFRVHGGTWELRVQLCTDLEAMPIEDAKVVWPESKSPYVAVATLVVPAQEAWSDKRSAAIDDGLAFSPWHGLAAHRPLGSVNRMRRAAYDAARRFRATHNHVELDEPHAVPDLPIESPRKRSEHGL